VTEPMVRKATVGMKEMECSNLDVLNDLFSPMPKKRVKELGLGEEEESKYVGRLSREVDATGSIDRVAIGSVHSFIINYILKGFRLL
jgi:chromosome transmission fidelity protein 18